MIRWLAALREEDERLVGEDERLVGKESGLLRRKSGSWGRNRLRRPVGYTKDQKPLSCDPLATSGYFS